MKEKVNIFWFRRDLRLQDNAGLFHALSGEHPVLPLFIFDTCILQQLEHRRDARVHFIHNSLQVLQQTFVQHGSTLCVMHAVPVQAFEQLLEQYDINTVFTNNDYEPYAVERDAQVKRFLSGKGVHFRTFKDQVIFEKDQVVKSDGSCYTVYSPYANRWLQLFKESSLQCYETESLMHRFLQRPAQEIVSLKDIGFAASDLPFPPLDVQEELIGKYELTRNFPAAGTSRLGVHLRFGTISIRHPCAKGL